MKKSNPKPHDNLFKWLIRSFIDEFFTFFFPNICVQKVTFIDKEFISKYKALKDSLKGDLFIAAEVLIDNQLSEIVIHNENQSKKEHVGERVFEYLCYAWLLKKKPVWSIVLFSGDAVWRKPLPDKYWYGFNSVNMQQFHKFDLIKLKDHKSSDLIHKQSLLCKLLALKANDKGVDPEYLVKEIYIAVSQMKDQLSKDKLLLIERFVSFYKKISFEKFEQIKKELVMTDYAETISDYYIQHGEKKGEKKGKKKGEKIGKKIGKMEATISIINNLLTKAGIDWKTIKTVTGIDQKQYQKMQQEYQQLVPVRA